MVRGGAEPLPCCVVDFFYCRIPMQPESAVFSNASVASAAHASSGVEAGALPAVSLARFPGLDRHASRCKIRLLGFVERSDEPKDDEGSSCCSFGPRENPLLDLVHMRIDPGSDDRRKAGESVPSIKCP